MKMIVRELLILTGGSSTPKVDIKTELMMPWDPNNAVNPMATTIVGMTKGKVDKAFRRVLPGNSYLAKRNATGRPTAKVSNVDTTACHIVNQIRPR